MKTSLLLLAVAGAVASASDLEKVMPEPFPEDRYQGIRSPFGLATPVAAPVVADKSFADGWYLAGVSQLDGKNYVTIRSRDQSVAFALYGDARHEQEGPGNGVKLQNVEWSPTFGRTSATIEKDGQFAKIELLNQTELTAAAPALGINPGAAPRPPGSINPGGKAPLPNAYPQPGASPQQRNVIPRPSGQPVAPQPAPAYQITPGMPPKAGAQLPNSPTAPAAAPSSEGRRRIRMIPTQPTQPGQ